VPFGNAGTTTRFSSKWNAGIGEITKRGMSA
jgi:hypothetical protein